jgi:hypothetical protein
LILLNPIRLQSLSHGSIPGIYKFSPVGALIAYDRIPMPDFGQIKATGAGQRFAAVGSTRTRCGTHHHVTATEAMRVLGTDARMEQHSENDIGVHVVLAIADEVFKYGTSEGDSAAESMIRFGGFEVADGKAAAHLAVDPVERLGVSVFGEGQAIPSDDSEITAAFD